jgi:hypothetical protein
MDLLFLLFLLFLLRGLRKTYREDGPDGAYDSPSKGVAAQWNSHEV